MRVWIGLALAAASCGNPNDASYWIKRLDNPEKELQAVQNLTKIGDPAAVEPLCKLFAKKRHPDILRAIVSFKEKPGFKREQVVPTLISALDFGEDDYNNATIAAEAAADLGATEVIDALGQALEKTLPVKSRSNLAKLSAIQALARLKDKRGVDALIKTMEKPPEEQDFLLAKKAADALGEIGDEKAVRPLIRGLFYASTAHKPMFVEASIALLKIGPPAVQPLIDAHQGKDADLSALATKLQFQPGIMAHKTALVLGDLRAKDAVPALRATVRAKQEGDNHLGSLDALGRIGDPAALPDIVWALEKHPDYKMRQKATEALLLFGSKDVLPPLLKAAKEGYVVQEGEKYDNVRIAAAMAFARLAGADGYDQLKPIAEAMKKDERDPVWDECLVRLELSRDCKDDAACYGKALDDAVLAKQESAAFHLVTAADGKSQLPALLKKLGTKDEIIRQAVLYALDRLADKSCKTCVGALRDQIEREKNVRVREDLVMDMRRTLARISRI